MASFHWYQYHEFLLFENKVSKRWIEHTRRPIVFLNVVCDKFQYWWPFFYMIKIDSAQVFIIKFVECHVFLPLIRRSRIFMAWAASFEEEKMAWCSRFMGQKSCQDLAHKEEEDLLARFVFFQMLFYYLY
jgi:hypothetical protein